MIIDIKKLANYNFQFLLFFILGVTSCTSDLSNKKIENISLIYAEIEIIQNPLDRNSNSVVVNLLDKNGKRISNDSLTIFVNNIEEKLYHKQGLYYTDQSKYIFSNVPVNEQYNVEIKLSNGDKYFLGSVKALVEENQKNIECKELGDINSDFVIKWHDLNDIDELSVFVGMAEKTAPNITTMNNKEEKIMKINNSGIFTIPKAEYKDTNSIINGIEFNFRTTKSGKTNPKLLENSTITIKTSIVRNITFTE